MGKPENNKRGERYYFFLNPYREHAFSKCPNCGKLELNELELTEYGPDTCCRTFFEYLENEKQKG